MAPSRTKYKILGRSGLETRKDDWKNAVSRLKKYELISGQIIK
jgi:hypothetical protein